MDKDDLIRKLNSVGKTAFAMHYDLFQDYAQGVLSKEQAIEGLLQISNPAGAAIRLSNAKPIFQAGLERDALALVMSSNRISDEARDAATKMEAPLARKG